MTVMSSSMLRSTSAFFQILSNSSSSTLQTVNFLISCPRSTWLASMVSGRDAVSTSFWSCEAEEMGPSGVRRTGERLLGASFQVPLRRASLASCHALAGHG